MSVTFSYILDSIKNQGIPCTEIHVDNSRYYEYFEKLTREQGAYIREYLYIGAFSDYNADISAQDCGFIFFSTKEIAPPDNCEYIVIDDQYIPSVSEILRKVFFKNSTEMQTAQMMISIFLHGKGLKYLIDICCDILENPVVLCDPSSAWFIYSSKYKVTAPDIQELIKKGAIPAAYFQGHLNLQTGKKSQLAKPFLINSDIFSTSPRIAQGINIDNQLVAILTVHECHRPFTANDYGIVQFISTVITQEIQSMGTPLNALYEYQLLEMMQGEQLSEKQQSDWCTTLGWTSSYCYYICIVPSENVQRYQIETSFRNKYRQSKNCKITRLKNNIILFINCTSKKSEIDFFIELNDYLNASHLRSAVSEPFHSLDEISYQYKLACEAASIGSIIMPEKAVVSFEEVSAYCLIHNAASASDLEQYISPQIKLLKCYDKRYGTEYYQTLLTFLTCMDKVKTTKTLNIHRNTLNYRLQKISEILEVNLEDSSTCFNFQLSFYIEKYLKMTAKIADSNL